MIGRAEARPIKGSWLMLFIKHHLSDELCPSDSGALAGGGDGGALAGGGDGGVLAVARGQHPQITM